MDYEMYKRGVDVKSFNEQLLQSVLYSSEVEEKDGETVIRLKGEGHEKKLM